MDAIYFQALVSKHEHPTLFAFLEREYASKDKVRGLAKRFICDAAEARLTRQESNNEEREHEELMRRLDEIKRLLESGKLVAAGTAEEPTPEPAKHSLRVSDRLRRLGM